MRSPIYRVDIATDLRLWKGKTRLRRASLHMFTGDCSAVPAKRSTLARGCTNRDGAFRLGSNLLTTHLPRSTGAGIHEPQPSLTTSPGGSSMPDSRATQWPAGPVPAPAPASLKLTKAASPIIPSAQVPRWVPICCPLPTTPLRAPAQQREPGT